MTNVNKMKPKAIVPLSNTAIVSDKETLAKIFEIYRQESPEKAALKEAEFAAKLAKAK